VACLLTAPQELRFTVLYDVDKCRECKVFIEVGPKSAECQNHTTHNKKEIHPTHSTATQSEDKRCIR
jgi:hypothetical protein